jgi:hypothetical protein
MLRKTLAVLAGALVAASLAAPVRAAEPGPSGFVPRTDPLPDGQRHLLAEPVSKPGGTAVGTVVGGDQGGHQVVVFDAKTREWTQDAAKWAWTPTAANGFGDVAGAFSLPSDVRTRTYKGKVYVLAADSKGFLGAVEYPSGKRLWATNAGAPSNPHATELLPNGNVAAAASTGGWVRVYAASQGPASAAYTQFALKGGHGVLWDPPRQVLWAVGDDDLVSLKVGGTPDAPTLTEESRVALPAHGGHDLSPVYGDRDRLWITTHVGGVYQYVKSENAFTTAYRFAPSVNLPVVKAVGNNPATKQVLLTRPKAGCATTWCTDTVEFFGNGSMNATRTFPGAQFYKVRWFVPAYQ